MECGWVLSEVDKEALRVLEELETKFPGKSFLFLYKHRKNLYECFIKEQSCSSITRQSPPNNPRECDTTTTTRPSSDFSSVGPSQSASQVTLNHDHEGQPFHSVINAPAFGKPISPSIATTTTVAAPALPAESNTTCPRPLAGNSTTTTTGSSIHYSVATHQPPTHTHSKLSYAQALPLHVGSSSAVVTKEMESSMDKGKAKEDDIFPFARSLEAGARTRPSRMRCLKAKIYTWPCGSLRRMRLRAMRQGYRMQDRCRGSINTAGIRRRSKPSSGVGMPRPQPQLQLQPAANLDDGK